MKERILPVLILIFLGLALANLLILDYFWLQERETQEEVASLSTAPSPGPSPIAPVSLAEDSCGSVCQQAIESKVEEAMASLPATETIKETTVVQQTTETFSQPTVIYIPLGGGGSTTSREWADVGNAEVYFDASDYPNLEKAYFEAFVRVKHGNGRAYARLYDVTHGIGVQGGEVYTDSEDFTLVESGSLSFWQGKNLYRVQIKSLNGYEVFYDSGRIKLILR